MIAAILNRFNRGANAVSIGRSSVFSLVLLAVCPAAAQFAGPAVTGDEMTIEEARSASVDTYVTVTGAIASHLREEYYIFRDESGEIRVEIADDVWAGQQVTPDDTVRLRAEVDRRANGEVYLWAQSLEIVEP